MYTIIVSKESILQIGILIAVIVLLFLVELFKVNIDYLLATATLLVLMKLAYSQPNFIIRYIMLIFMAVGNLVGVFICEHSSLWLVELGVRSGYQGSFPLLLAGWTILIFVVWMLDKRHPINTDLTHKEFVKIKLGNYSINLYQILVVLAFIFAIIFSKFLISE